MREGKQMTQKEEPTKIKGSQGTKDVLYVFKDKLSLFH